MRVGRVLTRECGFDARAADEEGLVAAVRRHAAEAHCMPLSHDEALLDDFARFWDEEPSPLERRKLISTLFDRVWQDGGRIVAVRRGSRSCGTSGRCRD